MTVFVVYRIHRGPEASDDCDTICGVFRHRGDAQACLGNEYRAVRPADSNVFFEDRPEDNDFMFAEVIRISDESDRIEITERSVL